MKLCGIHHITVCSASCFHYLMIFWHVPGLGLTQSTDIALSKLSHKLCFSTTRKLKAASQSPATLEDCLTHLISQV